MARSLLQRSKTPICPDCGEENRPFAKYCRNRDCGTRLPEGWALKRDRGAVGWSGIVGRPSLRDTWERRIREARQFQRDTGHLPPLHSLFLGVSGTGKTTIARRIARLLREADLLSSEPEVEYLKAFDVPTGPDALEDLFHRASGGVLLVDDIHKCMEKRIEPPTLLDRLVAQMEADAFRVDPVVFVTGELNDLRAHLEEYPDLVPRFDEVYELPALSLDEMTELGLVGFRALGLEVDDAAASKLRDRLRHLRFEQEDGRQFGWLVEHTVRRSISAFQARTGQGLSQGGTITEADVADPVRPEKSVEQILASFDDLIGMEEVRDFIRTTVEVVRYKKEQAEEDSREYRFSDHVILTGNPGTGKTTVARKLGPALAAAGLLDTGHVVETSPEQLVADHVGGTGRLVHETCDRALGGILFVDEAYSFLKNDQFGEVAVDTLMKRVEDDRGKFVVVLAGYRDQISDLMDANPGMSSRFPHHLHLEDYDADELAGIFEILAAAEGVAVADDVRRQLPTVFEQLSVDPDFQNGRGVRNYFEKWEAERVQRVTRTDGNVSHALLPKDLELEVEDREEALKEARRELDRMVGLDAVKEKVESLVRRAQIEERIEGAPSAVGHMLFRGNPGTGKTTVARKIGRILYGLGLLPKGHLVEVQASDLIAGYVGQTGDRTRKQIRRALGGVLFVDEAYGLTDSRGGFGQEAINELVPAMTNHAGEFVLVAAGYPDEMERFVASNPGLARRFTAELRFSNYTAAEIAEIFTLQAESSDKCRGLGDGFRDALERNLAAQYNDRVSRENAGYAERLLSATLDRAYRRILERERKTGEQMELREGVILKPEDLPEKPDPP